MGVMTQVSAQVRHDYIRLITSKYVPFSLFAGRPFAIRDMMSLFSRDENRCVSSYVILSESFNLSSIQS